MLVADFDYDLPEELIAQFPAERRDESRMLVLDRESGDCELKMFSAFPDYLQAGDCLVVNDTRVLPARIFGTKIPTGAKIEALLTEEHSDGVWEAMLRPGKRAKPGTQVAIDETDAQLEVLEKLDETYLIRFSVNDVVGLLEEVGRMPLPPYIQREAEQDDLARYQTVYAEEPGAVAAPTAGLHFTPDIITRIRKKGVEIVHVTLHVGIGTFRPVKVDSVEDHQMHFERYSVSEDAAATINQRREAGSRIVAVGTTSVRTLESVVDEQGRCQALEGRTNLFMYPPRKPRAVDALLTNFHLPKSTLLMLVSCFADREKVLAAYRLAIQERMRFFSYGDCMFLQ